jgi:cytochrome c553
MFLMTTAFASAQIVAPKADVLGPHLNYGRGCGSCHVPHSASAGKRAASSADAAPGVAALWGEDVTGFYEETTRPRQNGDADMPTSSEEAEMPDVRGLTGCLSCHDGNYSSPAMMRNRIYEKVPATYGDYNSIPTLLDDEGLMGGDFLSNHPVGITASIKCGGQDGWDCSQSEGVVVMKGARSSQFVRDYGFFVKPAEYNNTAVVVCTTCHEPHRRNVFAVGPGSRSGLPPGNYATMFFLRGPYNPGSPNLRSDTTSQFCRQCHASQSNEMNGAMIATMF